ncbi:MAG: acyl-CoA thioesterase [Spirochaetales bacterium]|nr:acyl-CoA thioesterase [Spirochaetales bacterium]
MDTFTLVRPEHLNHHGYLFGGQLLKWVDEFAWLVAARDYPYEMLVTRAMDSIEFKTKVENGSILRFHTLPGRKGSTSITYSINVFAVAPRKSREEHVFSTDITLVCIDDKGRKKLLPSKKELKSEIADSNS